MNWLLILVAAGVILGFGYLIWSISHRPVRPADERMTAVDAELTGRKRRRPLMFAWCEVCGELRAFRDPAAADAFLDGHGTDCPEYPAWLAR